MEKIYEIEVNGESLITVNTRHNVGRTINRILTERGQQANIKIVAKSQALIKPEEITPITMFSSVKEIIIPEPEPITLSLNVVENKNA
jgi:hypothetical protein